MWVKKSVLSDLASVCILNDNSEQSSCGRISMLSATLAFIQSLDSSLDIEISSF